MSGRSIWIVGVLAVGAALGSGAASAAPELDLADEPALELAAPAQPELQIEDEPILENAAEPIADEAAAAADPFLDEAAAAEAAAEPAAEAAPEPAEAGQSDQIAKPQKPKSRKAKSEAKAPAESNLATPPMWRVADDDTEIILLGTFHILPPDVEWRSPELGRAIDAADALWFEAEIDTPEAQTETIRILKSQGYLKRSDKLSGLLDEADAAKLSEIAASLGLPPAVLDTMRPWQAFLILSVKLIEQKGFEPSSGLETKLLAEGRARGRDFVFLETVGQQLGFFTGLAPEVEKSLLALTVRDWEKQTEEFDRLYLAWKAGDAHAIDEIMNGSLRTETPEVYEVLVRQRNEAWTARIAAALEEPGRKLVAVGAAHLVGADGVPAMLEAAGFSAPRYGVAANDNESNEKGRKKKRKSAE